MFYMRVDLTMYKHLHSLVPEEVAIIFVIFYYYFE